jgi:protein-S-isoprenylcysteine O-methyltransferase Ste14
MKNKKDNPGVYIPPPLIYVAVFLIGFLFQSKIPIGVDLLKKQGSKIIGIIIIAFALFFMIRGMGQFLKSKNSLITIRPASSLQSNGVYNLTRNPMYLGLALIYLGLTCLIGNWWNLILFPLLILIVQEYIIKREEKYLERRFGQEYLDYKQKVRRWL